MRRNQWFRGNRL